MKNKKERDKDRTKRFLEQRGWKAGKRESSEAVQSRQRRDQSREAES
jgi:hypothetical protein